MYTYKNSERLGEIHKKIRYCNYKRLKCNFLKITRKTRCTVKFKDENDKCICRIKDDLLFLLFINIYIIY